MSIRSGETIGLIGGTGSAKSSLVNLISRLYDVQEGSVKVGGLDVRKYEMEALRNQVSVVLQKNVLFSGTIFENLRWGDKTASDEECIRACKLACADEFIERFPERYNTSLSRAEITYQGFPLQMPDGSLHQLPYQLHLWSHQESESLAF